MLIARYHFSVAGLVRLAFALSAPSVTSAENESVPSPQGSLSPGSRFTETSGEQLFVSFCQGCHMPDGNGATGCGQLSRP